MRKLVYYVATTLDGYIAGPDGGDPSAEDYFLSRPMSSNSSSITTPRLCPDLRGKPWVLMAPARYSTPF